MSGRPVTQMREVWEGGREGMEDRRKEGKREGEREPLMVTEAEEEEGWQAA